MADVGVFGYQASAVLYLALAVALVFMWRGRFDRAMLSLAMLMTVAWAIAEGFFPASPGALPADSLQIEVLRNLVWLLFLAQALRGRYPSGDRLPSPLRYGAIAATAVGVALLLGLLYVEYDRVPVGPAVITPLAAGFLSLSVCALVSIEQLLRGMRPERRRAGKYLYIAVAGTFAYDLVLYADALVFGGIDDALWQGRGMFAALLVPLMAVATVTNAPRWSRDVYVSHGVVFHATTLIFVAVYLLALFAGARLLPAYDGHWGSVIRVQLVAGGVLFMVVLLCSARLRAHLRVFVGKHFFNYKYDYREEWLRIIRTLSKGGAGAHLLERAVQAIAQIVDSPGGILWLQRDQGYCEPAAHWEAPPVSGVRETADGSLVRFLAQWQWVISLDEYRDEPDIYEDLALPEWLRSYPRAWLVVPLMLDVELLGFIVLVKPPVRREINWEDRDLLKTAARQAATHIAQLMAAQALIEAREFQAFSKLSAFVMHDLKNLIAQLSLVVANAARHKNNPAFLEDAIKTVDNSVTKMTRLIAQLKTGAVEVRPAADECNLVELVHEAVTSRSGRSPAPEFVSRDGSIAVRVNRDRMISVIEHLIENAQDATPPDGKIEIRLKFEHDHAVIDVRDTGCGMDADFMRNQLFRPFRSTKGSGMGIGAFESREFVREHGGDITVTSEPGRGTTFRIRIPAVRRASGAAA